MWWFLVIPPSQIEPNSDWCMIVACHYENIPRSQFLTKILGKSNEYNPKKRSPTRLETLTFPIRFKQTQSTKSNKHNKQDKQNTCFFDVFWTKIPPPKKMSQVSTVIFWCFHLKVGDISVLALARWFHWSVRDWKVMTDHKAPFFSAFVGRFGALWRHLGESPSNGRVWTNLVFRQVFF